MQITFCNNTEAFTVDFGLFSGSGTPGKKPPGDIETYTGEYDIDPDFAQQVLETRNKLMADNVTVEPIEVQRVSNAAGGRTVYIGGLIDG